MSAAALGRPQLLPAEFESLRRTIKEVAGIHLRDTKRDLVESRLHPRLRQLQLSSFGEYLRLLSRDTTGEEQRELVNRITTNKTSFYREPHHFDYLDKTILPAIIARGQKKIRIWSAGCSTGQEPWTMAICLANAIGSLAGWDIRILASDLDTNVLETAQDARYDDLDGVPDRLQKRYFEEVEGRFQVVEELRALVTFRQINLVAPATWSVRTRFDAVFCRNVAIYFDRATQETVFTALASKLEPTGHLMSGHSENLHWLAHVLRPIGQTVHVLAKSPGVAATEAPRAAPPALPVAAQKTVVSRPVLRAVPSTGAGKREIAIQVGGIHASAQGAMVRTTLGSCVAACLYDPEARIGGMNHFLLPEDRGGNRGPTNFGIHAMELLINSIMKLGGDRRRFVAKLFGASELFPSGVKHVARLNAEFAQRFLDEEGIPVIAHKLGGPSPLAVLFDTAEGRVTVRTLGGAKELAADEKRYRDSLETQVRPIADDITFFGTP